LTTWGNSSSIPSGDNTEQTNGEQPLAHDGPVLAAGDELDPAGAVTARTVEAGPSHVGEGTPSDEEGSAAEASRKKRGKARMEEGEASGSELSRKRGKRSISVDSDELDQDTPATSAAATPPTKKKKKAKPGPLKPIASIMVCGECDKNFTVVRQV
jgi:DNA repair protein RAD7